MRVCAFANWPGRLEPRKCAAVMHVADWFPTIAHLVGWEPTQAPAWDGLDRWDAITGVPEAHSRPRPVCVVHPSGRAVIGDRWKLIVLDKTKKREESLQLYDLLADPFETTDLAVKEPTVVAEYLAIAKADAALDLADMPADLRDAPP
jgi:arylsulfatase A-like enzyme